MARRLVLLAIVLLTSLPSCVLSPRIDVNGTWVGRYGKFGGVYLVLQQDGDTITGHSCDFDSIGLLYSGAPVRGDYPRMRVVVAAEHVAPCCGSFVGRRLDAAVFDKREITGAWTFPDGRLSTDVLDFRRTESAPAGCAGQ